MTTILPRLYEIYRDSGHVPLTGFSPFHMHDWRDAPFTRFLVGGRQVIGCAGLSLLETLFVERLGDLVTAKSILVIGNAHGWSTIALALTFPGARVVAIDPDEPGIALTNQLAERHGLPVVAVRGESPGDVASICREHLPGPVDFCLVDAVHSDEAVVADVRAARSGAAADALYLLHDVINWALVGATRKVAKEIGLEATFLTRTCSGMALLHGPLPEALARYVACFSDPPGVVRSYRNYVKRTFRQQHDRAFDDL